MHCITMPRLPPINTLIHSARVVLKNYILSAAGKRTQHPHHTPKSARKLRYALCSPRLCASLGRILPTYGLIQTTTSEGTWFRIGSLTIRLTDRVVSLYAGTKAAVPLGLLTLIAAEDPLLSNNPLIVPENGDRIKKCLDYLTDHLHLPYTAAIAFMVIIPKQSESPGVSLTDLAASLPNPARFHADCQALVTNNLISITGDQITLTPAGTRIAHSLISRWFRRA